MNTTIAVVAAFDSQQPIVGVPFFLVTEDGHQLLADVSNLQGYMRWNNVPIPFVGKVRGAAGIIQFYEQPISIPANAVNVSVRIGDRNNPAPQDILLPAPLPFKKPVPVPIPRGPLPAFDPNAVDPDTGAPLPVHTTLNLNGLAGGVIPPLTDPSYHRANLWAVTCAGAPAIPGGGQGPSQNRLLTYLVDRYPADWQARWLKTYGQRGYRHFWHSIPDSRDGTGLSVSQYCDLTKRTLDAGLIPCHFLRSKDYDGRNPDPTLVYPWIDSLLKIPGGFSEASFAWEASLFYSPEAFAATIQSDATRYPNARWGVHLQQGYPHFGPNIPDSVKSAQEFWEPCIAVGVKTLLYQFNYDVSGGMQQAKFNDVLVRLPKGALWGLSQDVRAVAFEVIAQAQFNNENTGDGRLADEDMGDLRGYEMLCTPGPLAPLGFGNGARMPDGRVI